jgi:hypothetical protein
MIQFTPDSQESRQELTRLLNQRRLPRYPNWEFEFDEHDPDYYVSISP